MTTEAHPNEVRYNVPSTRPMFSVHPGMFELHPGEQETIYCISTFSFQSILRKVGQRMTQEEFDKIYNYQNAIDPTFGENWKREHTSRSNAVATHWHVIKLLTSLRDPDNDGHNERVMNEVMSLTRDLLPYYLEFFCWWNYKSSLAHEIARMIKT